MVCRVKSEKPNNGTKTCFLDLIELHIKSFVNNLLQNRLLLLSKVGCLMIKKIVS